MVNSFSAWCFEDGRKAGDTGIVKSDNGYHIMYFVGYGDTQYWHYACEDALRSNAETEWQNTLTESAVAEINDGGMKQVG